MSAESFRKGEAKPEKADENELRKQRSFQATVKFRISPRRTSADTERESRA